MRSLLWLKAAAQRLKQKEARSVISNTTPFRIRHRGVSAFHHSHESGSGPDYSIHALYQKHQTL